MSTPRFTLEDNNHQVTIRVDLTVDVTRPLDR